MSKEKKQTILLVDDDSFLLDMYSVKFTEKGFDVQTSSNGNEVVDMLENGDVEPSVILLDIVMPNMDGLEILGKIKGNNLAPQATVIMLSNQGAPTSVDEAMKLGADGYIIKASTIPSEVYDKVMELVAKHTSS